MIVFPAERTISDGKVIISAVFEFENPPPHIPSRLWYSFPEKYDSILNTRADAFVPLALLIAMNAGEDLEIRGDASPLLAENLLAYRDQFSAWWPEDFKTVDLKFSSLVPASRSDAAPIVMTTFSGGVDSFYSLWENLPEKQLDTAKQITHGIFISGVDLRLEDEENYRTVFNEYHKLLKELNLELIEAATNVWQFSEFRVNWTKMFGAATISIAHLFSRRLRRFYFPSDAAVSWADNKHGSSPLVDHLLSSESVEIVHQGIYPGRGEKIRQLVQWPVSHHKLRVCSDKIRMQGLQNCSRCHKCYRTMAWLELEDADQYYANFNRRMTFRDYLRWGLQTHLNKTTALDIRREAWNRRNYRMVVFTQLAIYLNSFRKFTIDSFKKILGPRLTYSIKRLVYKPESKE